MTQGPPSSQSTNQPTTPPASPQRNEGEFARRLALGILSTLERKGILTENDVDTILQAAYRAAQAQAQVDAAAAASGQPPAPAPTLPRAPLTNTNSGPMSRPQITAGPPAAGPAALGTRWVKPQDESEASTQNEVKPTNTEPGESVRIIKPLTQAAVTEVAATEAAHSDVIVLSDDAKQAEESAPAAPKPPLIDFTLD